ncbi:hypothetical protein KR222_004794, partial [Zaprionus bogoriensis]
VAAHLQMPEENELDESDCCGNGCTNCILDNRPKPTQRALLAGKRNVILQYAPFRLLSNEAHAGDEQVRLLHFGYAQADDDGDSSILDIPPGHHVMLRVEASLLRPYSPYWTDFAAKEFKILVKLWPGGRMSTYLAALRPEQLLEFRGPIGNYAHDAHSAKCIVIIAQGVAIAPTLPLVEQVLDNEDDMNRIEHLICARDLQHVYFRQRLLQFAQYWNYRSCLYLAHHECSCCPAPGATRSTECEQLRQRLRYKEAAHTGHLEASELAAQVSRREAPTICIIAGHSTFQQRMREMAMRALDLSDDSIYLL